MFFNIPRHSHAALCILTRYCFPYAPLKESSVGKMEGMRDGSDGCQYMKHCRKILASTENVSLSHFASKFTHNFFVNQVGAHILYCVQVILLLNGSPCTRAIRIYLSCTHTSVYSFIRSYVHSFGCFISSA